MSHLKKRIKKLEVQVFGEEDQLGFTWEEFQQLCRFLDQERFKREAQEPGNMQARQIAESPIPKNIKQLVRRWERFKEEYRRQTSECRDRRALAENAMATAIPRKARILSTSAVRHGQQKNSGQSAG